ncbi:hypothetical protein [Klebsiella aerogenes]|uniref:hypothetical protein n=2 Tax=Klebsiella aerogenes TaxID=548 RepID=UPI00254E511B|nr:hypothetical protein [Klebsiella aerogenes]EMB4079905.1 hypothetical protein [Klebsiella aerogenes]MDK6928858.1 hypothetical protein [Klebsiella aerogenes]HBQ0419678.1 hypothetical protein [Klebsiella aerogenes]
MGEFIEDNEQNEKDNESLKENCIKMLEKSANILSAEQFDYLLELIKSGQLGEFRRLYWEHLSQHKSKKEMSDSFKENNSISEYLNNKPEDKLILKKEINVLRKKLHNAEKNLVINEAHSSNLELAMKKKDSQLEYFRTKVNQLETSNNELLSRVQQERIDQKIPGYVENVKNDLGYDDEHFILMSKVWAAIGGVFGVLAVVFSFISMYITIDFNTSKGFELFYLFTRGLIGISLLSWLAYICLSNSKKYTHESIRRKDRRHALMFGQVFLQIYGSTATKEDAVLVFKDWNMSGDSAFSDQTERPPSIQTLWDAAKEKLKATSDKSST